MHSFHPDRLNHALVSAGTAWLMGAYMEARGKQELWRQRSPELLEALRELSIVQSAESSNRIEGVVVSKDRLRPLILGNATPADRPEEDLLPPLLAAGALIFDFLCIHPFRDGNGRVSRLLTLLALYQQGFEVGRYVSLERLVEAERETYYNVLATSSAHWHNATHDLVPWWNHFLSTLRQAYISLSKHLEIVGTGPGKSELVRQAILRQTPTFTLREILAACPSVSPQLARKVLSQQRADGYLTLTDVKGRLRARRRRQGLLHRHLPHRHPHLDRLLPKRRHPPHRPAQPRQGLE